MIPLDKIVNKNTYTYTQVLRGKRYCLYEQNGIANMKCFELFEIKIRPKKVFKGVILEEKELFPKDKDFGKTAWTICDLDKALAKFNELENK